MRSIYQKYSIFINFFKTIALCFFWTFAKASLVYAYYALVNLVRNLEFNTSYLPMSESIAYTHTFYRLVKAARALGHQNISLEMDMLNSFSDSHRDYAHFSDIKIQHSVPAVKQ